MLKIAIRTKNKFFMLGLMCHIENIFSSQHQTHYECIERDPNSEILLSDNIIFTDKIALVNIFNNDDQDPERQPHTTIHINFNICGLFHEDISSLISKIINLSRMTSSQLNRDDFFRKLMARNNANLSATESRLVMLMGQGHDTTNLSQLLNCSIKTVYTHRRNAIRKLGMINRVQFYSYLVLLKKFSCSDNIFLSL